MSTYTGKKFQELRLAAGLKQTEVANIFGVSGQSISNLEGRDVVKPVYFLALAAATGRNLEQVNGVAS